MKVDSDPLQVAETSFVEPFEQMVDMLPLTRKSWKKVLRVKGLSKVLQKLKSTRIGITIWVGGKLATIEQAGGNVVAVKPVEACALVVKEPEMVKKPIKERISLLPNTPPIANVEEEDEYMEDEYDLEESLPVPDIKLVCYYVMDNGCVEQQQAIFEKPNEGMKNHLKPLFVREKYETDLHSHSIVLSNYEGKSDHSWGAIQVDVAIGSSVRPTLFLVVPSKVNYNLLLGKEWIHGVGAIPSTLHQRLTIWREDGVVENIEADQSYYLSEVNYITKQTFDKNLALIAPCGEKNAAYEDPLSDNE
ncbi:hypothetical protein L195_g044281, partial [Trifolium pratense]